MVEMLGTAEEKGWIGWMDVGDVKDKHGKRCVLTQDYRLGLMKRSEGG